MRSSRSLKISIPLIFLFNHLKIAVRSFAPPAPKTKPKIDKARYYEERLDVEGLLARAMENITITDVKIGDEFMNEKQADFAELL